MNADEEIKELDEMINNLETENIKLKELVIWMTGCGYDFCQHDYFIQQRDELLKGYGARSKE